MQKLHYGKNFLELRVFRSFSFRVDDRKREKNRKDNYLRSCENFITSDEKLYTCSQYFTLITITKKIKVKKIIFSLFEILVLKKIRL